MWRIRRAADSHLIMAELENMKPKPKPSPAPKRAKKLDPDYFFSLCVRERADWTCQACGKKYEPWTGSNGYPANPGLHCSHYIGRANYAVRHDPINVVAHCYGCHAKFEGNPHVFMTWTLERLGQKLYDILIEKSNDIMLGKQARQQKQEIASHYKEQFETMQLLRKDGKLGRIDFQGYF
jgi:hypothetical protein